jgi:glycosyltransferase involved in cell wall biosynthesis
MHIGIDYTAAVRQRAGIGRYTRNLVRALSDLDRRNRYTLFVAGRDADDGLGPWPENFRTRTVLLSDRWLSILWQRLRVPLPVQLVTGRLDLFHSPDFVLPPLGRTPAVLTVHDLSFLRVPHCFVPAFRSYLSRAVPRAVARAECILADSNSTRDDLAELLGVEAERITVLYPGVEARFRPVQEEDVREAVRIRYRLPERFVLGLSTLQPRKNFDGLVAAFARVAGGQEMRTGTGDVHLVVSGQKGWMYEEALTAAQRSGVADRIHFVGFVEDADLPALYSLASAFAFPSWYEGFGVPVLEAMACGTPVVAADNSSLPEVVGDAGLLVDAADVGGLAHALGRLLADEVLCRRLMRLGLERAQRFTWERAAEQLLHVYERACDKRQAK